jgi:hypothetical protein
MIRGKTILALSSCLTKSLTVSNGTLSISVLKRTFQFPSALSWLLVRLTLDPHNGSSMLLRKVSELHSIISCLKANRHKEK